MANRIWPVDAVAGAPQYSGRALRQSLMAPLVAGATSARPLGGRSGVRPGTSPATVTVSGSTWTVRPHAGVLDVLAATEAGPYGYAVDADVSGNITAANATNARRDLVYVQLEDPAESTGGTTPSVTPRYLAGTAAQSPATPTLPPRSMPLAEINVPAVGGGSPTVTWVAPISAAAGAVYRVRNAAERVALGTGTAVDPIIVRQGDTGAYWEEAGAGWVPLAPTSPRVAPITNTACGPTDTKNAEVTSFTIPPGPSHLVQLTFTGFIYNASSSGQILVKFRLNGADTPGGPMNFTYGGTLGDRFVIQGLTKTVSVPPGTHSLSVWTGAGSASVSYDTQYIGQLAVADLGPVA